VKLRNAILLAPDRSRRQLLGGGLVGFAGSTAASSALVTASANPNIFKPAFPG